MTSLAVQPFSGTYGVLSPPSTFGFAVRHSGVFWFRGALTDVTAALRGDGDAVAIEGSARVESISVVEPAVMRAHVLGPEFFHTERHPEITFRSTAVRLGDDGGAEVDGQLTIRGVTRPISAIGQWAAPRAASFGEIAGLELHARLDRREFGMDWQAKMPAGGDAVSWEVEVDIDLLLKREAADETVG